MWNTTKYVSDSSWQIQNAVNHKKGHKWFANVFNLIWHTLAHRERDGTWRSEHSDGTDVSPIRVWRIAWLLISARRIPSRISIFWISTWRSRGTWVRPRVFGAFDCLPSSLRRALKSKESSGRTRESEKRQNALPRSFDIRPLDHRYHSPPSALPSPYLSLSLSLSLSALASVTTNNRTLLRYLAKAFPRSRHVHSEDNARIRVHTHICIYTFTHTHTHTQNTHT